MSKQHSTLLSPTELPLSSTEPLDLNTNILIIGGAFAGIATYVSLKQHLQDRLASGSESKISITLVEPRNGFLNILGIPKCIVDCDFATTQFIPFNKLENMKFTNVISKENLVDYTTNDDNLHLNYIQGKISNLSSNSAIYKLNDDEQEGKIQFDYCVICSGRDRNYPTTPEASNFDVYMTEMNLVKSSIESNNIISVIGAGAVGIEIAGDIKTQFPDKTVNLIHPHVQFPPEPLSTEFKAMTLESLQKVGINIIHDRVKGLKTGDLKSTSSDRVIKSDLNIWCNSKANNVSFLNPELKRFLSLSNNIYINQYLQLDNHNDLKLDHIFALGDLVEQPIIKSAGWAMYHGRLVANNITSLIFDRKLVEPLPNLKDIPFGMVLVGGSNEIISELAGVVELNHEGYKKEYQDYCIGKIKATLNV